MVPLSAKSLLVTGLTATLLLSCAGSAAARRHTLKDTMRRVHRASVRSSSASKRRPRPAVAGLARSPIRKRLVHLPGAGRTLTRGAAKALSSPTGVSTLSMLRPNGTAADLNPMPQLLDLGDRRRDMRRSTRRLHRMSRRWWADARQAPPGS